MPAERGTPCHHHYYYYYHYRYHYHCHEWATVRKVGGSLGQSIPGSNMGKISTSLTSGLLIY